MKVALVEPHGSGGICHYTYALGRALVADGVDLCVFTNDRYELEHLDRSFPVYSLSSSRLMARIRQLKGPARLKSGGAGVKIASFPDEPALPRSDRRISRFRFIVRNTYLQLEAAWRLKLLGVRVLHIQWAWPTRRDLMFVRVARSMGMKVVYTAHNVLPHDDESKATRKEMSAYYHAVDQIIVHDARSRGELLELFNVEASKVHVIPHGNYQFFAGYDAKGRTRTAIARQLGIPGDREVVLFFGSIQRYKGLNVLLSAFKAAFEQRPQLYLVIAGKVVDKDGEDAAYYRDLIDQLGISEAVDFRPGYVAMEDVPNYFGISDVVIAPYIKTYQSGIVQLAYAFGKPVIATDTGGLAEVVINGESGILVKPKNCDQLSRAIVEIFESGEIGPMSSHAAKLSHTLFGWENIAKATIRLYGD